MNSTVILTPLGNLKIIENETKVRLIEFTSENESSVTEGYLAKVVDELNEYFNGERQEFNFAMEPFGTEFQKSVWQELVKIPYGQTISYHELATRIGDPKTIRAAAAANGKNPIAIAIPCHRVIGSDGSMTGYAGGVERKKALLRIEGANVMSQTELFNEV